MRRILAMPSPGWWGTLRAPLTSLRAAHQLIRAIDDWTPELIYVWNSALLPATAIRAAGRAGIPLAFRVCEYWFGKLETHDEFMGRLAPGRRGLRGLWTRVLRVVNRHPSLRLDPSVAFPATICWNSDYVRAVTPIPRGVLPLLEDRIYPATPQGDRFIGIERTPSARPKIAVIGRVSPEKGVDVACRALAALRLSYGIDATLVVAGPIARSMRTELDRLVRELGIDPRVELLGPLDTAGLASLLADAHVVLVPPRWEEPAGLVCVEAALARVPVVASRSGGIPELLHDGEHALLFEIGDAEACARRLAETLTRPAEAEERVERAFVRARGLSFEPYIAATDRFITATMEAFTNRGRVES